MWWETAILGLIQGLTEFLPISSSGHLLLLQKFTNLSDFGLAFDAFLHLGTLLAVLIYFRKDIFSLFTGLFDKNDKLNKKVLLIILLSIIPAGLVGFLAKDFISNDLRLPGLVLFNLVFWALIMWWADNYIEKKQNQLIDLSELNWKQGLIIGLAQVLSLLPGTSRSGITITAGLFQSLSRRLAARFSFIMSIPLIAAAGLLNFIELIKQPEEFIILNISIGFLTSFIAGYFAIAWFIKILTNKNLKIFVWYRLILGFILFIFHYLV